MFTHIKENGSVAMVNVAEKPATRRTARASGFLRMAPSTIQALREKTLPKGDALVLSQAAGIQAAKWTPHLIPLCHSLEARNISVDISLEDNGARICSEVGTVAPTGPEMEALVACTVSGLTLYDICKALDRSMVLEQVRLDFKSGGKSELSSESLQGRRAVVLVLSDRASLGIYEDRSGPMAVQNLERSGFEVLHREIIPDDLDGVSEKIKHFCDSLKPDLLLTLGSTGLSPRDIAPEATARVIERAVPGIPEALRTQFFSLHPTTSFLSRGVAGLKGRTLIVNLPGKPSAVGEGLNFLIPALPHIFKTISGEGHE